MPHVPLKKINYIVSAPHNQICTVSVPRQQICTVICGSGSSGQKNYEDGIQTKNFLGR